MSAELKNFQKRKPFLVCVDSDGCAMDTMDVKHIECFGPCMVEEWNLDAWREVILERWNVLNLYSMTRGINRFKGLVTALCEIDRQYTPIEDLSTLVSFAENSPELSNGALQNAIEAHPESVILPKALHWSETVNAAIRALPEEKKLPFSGVREALTLIHQSADVAIVSSANLDAVLAEWKEHELLPQTDIVLSQNVGSKAYCIAELLKKGYAPENVVMCGDAPGDLDAAEKNGVFFYPILVRREKESWAEFCETGLVALLSGTFGGAYQQKKIKEFKENLGG